MKIKQTDGGDEGSRVVKPNKDVSAGIGATPCSAWWYAGWVRAYNEKSIEYAHTYWRMIIARKRFRDQQNCKAQPPSVG